MSKYKRFAVVMLGITLLVIFICNGIYLLNSRKDSGRIYRVETARVAKELQEKPAEDIDLSKYHTIVSVREFVPEENCNEDYVVEQAAGKLYRISYRQTKAQGTLVPMNIAFGCLFILMLFFLIYIGQKVLKPFHNMSELTCELAKGNLSVPIKAEKSRFFGGFLWGMDMLRDHLESDRQKELELQKEKKSLILSLSHDIKTPLAAIELYTRALSENLYDDEEKRTGALQGISRNAKEIEKYVNEIVTASREDFLNLKVQEGEFYLSNVMRSLELYYRDKLLATHTELVMEELTDCLLKGDENRLVEVLQNVMENAIKYGDGIAIRIFYADEEDCRLISVENSGCTLKEEELPHLFDSFYRGSNSHGVKGSGLGLYICKNLMRKMDGEVFAQMDGTRFRVTVVVRKA